MTIEAKLDELIALQKETNALLSGGASTAKASTAKASTKATKSDDDEEDEKPAPKKATTTKKSTAKPKTPTVAAMKKAATDFLEAAGEDEDEYVARKEHVKEIIGEYDVAKFSEIAAGDRLDALDKLNAYDSEGDGDGENEEDDDLA